MTVPGGGPGADASGGMEATASRAVGATASRAVGATASRAVGATASGRPEADASGCSQANASGCSQANASGVAPIVRLRAVSKRYGDYIAINSIDLDILNGEFITFLGPSGSGKTTTLMMLAGFEVPTSGSIEMDGRRIERLPAHRRNIGVVFQNYALFPHMTVRGNLSFPLKVRGVPRAEIARRVDAALAQVHLDGMGERRPGQLSGGQQQRVALARAIIFQPRLIVLDEPLGALDKNLREHLQTELKALHRDLRATMVFVTHDQSEALMLSDRVAVFNKGRIEQIGTPSELYRAPATPFVASFIGENNMLEGEVAGREAGEVVVRFAGGASLRAPAQDWCRAGGRVTFNLRPEALRLAPDTPTPGCQRVPAVVLDTIYLGDQNRVILDVEGVGRMVLKASAEGGRSVAPGDAVQVEIAVASGRVLARGQNAPAAEQGRPDRTGPDQQGRSSG